MIKKLFVGVLLAGVIGITGCEEQDFLFNGPHFVSFTQASVSLSENASSPLDAVVQISQKQDVDVEVSFEVSADGAVAGTDYNILTTSPVIIPAGQFEVPIRIEPIDNSDFETEARKVTLTITSVSNDIGVQVNSTSEINIVNDDCPSQSNIWWGNLSMEDVGFSVNPGVGSANSNGDCDILVIEGDLIGGGASAPITFYLTPAGDGATNGTIEAPKGLYDCCGPAYEYEASGTYDEATQTIELDYTFFQADGSVFWTGQTIITPN